MRPQLLSPARLALAVAVAVSACSLDLNRAWADPAMQRYALPAQPLDQALRQIARQSASTLVVDPALLRGRQSAAVNGQLSAEAAVRQAVAGSGLQLRVTDNGTLTLEKADSSDALQLGATSITGSTLGEVTENTGSYTTASMATATKFKASARETPQSVTVVTRQRMDDQNMQTLDDIASYTPGLTLRKTGGERPQFYSRGAAIDNIMVDGLPIAYDSDTLGTATLAMFDRVEVVRGASGLMVGSGNPSGTLNLVRKRPRWRRRSPSRRQPAAGTTTVPKSTPAAASMMPVPYAGEWWAATRTRTALPMPTATSASCCTGSPNSTCRTPPR